MASGVRPDYSPWLLAPFLSMVFTLGGNFSLSPSQHCGRHLPLHGGTPLLLVPVQVCDHGKRPRDVGNHIHHRDARVDEDDHTPVIHVLPRPQSSNTLRCPPAPIPVRQAAHTWDPAHSTSLYPLPCVPPSLLSEVPHCKGQRMLRYVSQARLFTSPGDAAACKGNHVVMQWAAPLN